MVLSVGKICLTSHAFDFTSLKNDFCRSSALRLKIFSKNLKASASKFFRVMLYNQILVLIFVMCIADHQQSASKI